MRPDAVVELPHLITANGPATAIAFALTIVKQAKGEQVAADTAAAMLCK